MADSPNGKTAYVTGYSKGASSGQDFVTVAYDAATGTQRWVARYHGPADAGSSAIAVAVSPDGTRVFVTGTTQNGDIVPGCLDTAYDTVAYRASTGSQLWEARVCGYSAASALAVSPDGKRVYVTGQQDAECGLCMTYGTWGHLGPRLRHHRLSQLTASNARAALSPTVVGDTGIEPVTSSV